MSCFHPLKAWRGPIGKTGRAVPVFEAARSNFPSLPFYLPCGRCIGCRLERARVWAVRCVHESKLYDDNCFITLTYRDEDLPLYGSLNVKHFQDFMKRLRVNIARRGDMRKLRIFYCGEYGEQFGRPHYHAVIFNYDFQDKELSKYSPSGEKIYTSSFLSECWKAGDCTVGNVTFQSAGYVGRYCVKKIVGDEASDYYSFVDDYGEVHSIVPPFSHSSNQNGGIGKGWFDRFKSDWYKSDELVMNGASMKIPRCYDKYFEIECPSDMKALKRARKASAAIFAEHQTPDRRAVREQVLKARLTMLRREL